MYELIFTSTPQGLIAGRSGFASVAWSEGMPANYVPILEALSAYKFPQETQSAPICYSYRKLSVGGKILRVVSRIAPAGLDYSGRNNMIAHHFLFENAQELEQIPGGAVALLRGKNNFLTEWGNRPSQLLKPRTTLSYAAEPSATANCWAAQTGDAGWAGVVLQLLLDHPEQNFYLEYSSTFSSDVLLVLFAELTALLPAERLDDFTFNSYFSLQQGDCGCFLRGCPADAPVMQTVRRSGAPVLTLGTHTPLPPEWETVTWVQAARTGKRPEDTPPAPSVESSTQPMRQLHQPEKMPEPQVPPLTADPQPGNEIPPVPGTAPRTSSSRRRILFAAVILFAGAALPSFWLLFGTKQPPPEGPVTVLSSGGKAVSPARPAPAPAPAQNTTPALSAPAPKLQFQQPQAPAPDFQAPPPAEAYKLFLQWETHASHLTLPTELAEADRIGAELDAVGEIQPEWIPAEERLRYTVCGSDPRRLRLLPARQTEPRRYLPDENRPQDELKIEFRFGDLVVTMPANAHDPLVPRIGNIAFLVFAKGSAQYRWPTTFQSSYVEAVAPGRVEFTDEWVLNFHPSDEENRYAAQLEIQVGAQPQHKLDNARLAKQIAAWNNALRQLTSLEGEKTALTRQLRPAVPCPSDEEWDKQYDRVFALFNDSDVAKQALFPAEVKGLIQKTTASAPGNETKVLKRLDQLAERIAKLPTDTPEIKQRSAQWRKQLQDVQKPIREQRRFREKCDSLSNSIKREEKRRDTAEREIRNALARLTPEAKSFFDVELQNKKPISNTSSRRDALSDLLKVHHTPRRDKGRQP